MTLKAESTESSVSSSRTAETKPLIKGSLPAGESGGPIRSDD